MGYGLVGVLGLCSTVFSGVGPCSGVRSAVPHSGSSFSELGQPDSSAEARC